MGKTVTVGPLINNGEMAPPPLSPGDKTGTNYMPIKMFKDVKPGRFVFWGTTLFITVPSILYGYYLYTRPLPETLSKEWRDETDRQFREGKKPISEGLSPHIVNPISQYRGMKPS